MFLVLFVMCFIVVGHAFESRDSATETPFIEQVITNNQDVCLLIDQSWLIADNLQASSEGMFVSLHGSWMPLAEAIAIGDYQASWRCSKCRRYNIDGVNVCPYCGKPKNS
jgi:hypothetical protein